MTKHSVIPRLGGILALLSFSACSGYQEQPATAPAAVPKPVQVALPRREVPPRFKATDKIAIKTSVGTITVALFGNDAPKTVANFLKYVERGYYNGKIFHRIINGFMIQGGGFDETVTRDETVDPIQLEIIPGLKHQPGIISMARQPNDIHSATTQFFICTADAPQLNGTYAAFGKVLTGEDVLAEISSTPTHAIETQYGKMNDFPIKPVLIESISRL